MPATIKTKRANYLSEIRLDELEGIRSCEKSGKSRDRLSAAILWKLGKTIKEIAKTTGYGASTIYRWLRRMDREGPDSRHDRKSPGRPRKLNSEQYQAIVEDLGKAPCECDFLRGLWSSKLVARRIQERFGISCSRRTALRIANRAGFTFRKKRPVPYNSATPEEQEEFKKDTKCTIDKWRKEGRVIVSLDAATMRDSPTSSRGLLKRGGKDVMYTNYSKESTHLIGALGEDG